MSEQQWFRNELAEFVYYRTYSRYRYDLGRREHWPETVQRTVDYLRELGGGAITDAEYQEVHDAILQQLALPSMRLFTMAGDAARRQPLCTFNCSALAIDSIDAFGEVCYLLCQGAGVGFGIEKAVVAKLPVARMAADAEEHPGLVVVEDSSEGWAEAFKEVIRLAYEGRRAGIDVSQVRPAGAPLRTKGGRSSGPEPLLDLMHFAQDIIIAAARDGRQLTTLEVHDICTKIGTVIVVGGVRRSAEISMSDLDDEALRHAKEGPFWEHAPWRAMANNSAIYEEPPTPEQFWTEWDALAASGTGERGVLNRHGIRKHRPERRQDSEFYVNPCGEAVLRNAGLCVMGNTPLITHHGVVAIQDAVNQEIEVWNGKQWSTVVPRLVGRNQRMVRVTLSDGSYLDCTEDHRFSVRTRFQSTWSEVAACDLMGFSNYVLQVEPTVVENDSDVTVDDAYTLGVAVGDGSVYRDRVTIDLYGAKQELPVVGAWGESSLKTGYNVSGTTVVCPQLDASLVYSLKRSPSALDVCFTWNRKSVLDFLAGWLDTDGTKVAGGGVRLYLSGEERARRLQLLLTKNGIRSSVCLLGRKGTETNYGMRNEDLWYLQITDCSGIPCHRLDTSTGHAPRFKGKFQTIRSVVNLDGLHDSYCFVEEREHKALFGNVLTFQCNLSEAVVRETDTLDDLKRKVRIAAIIGTLQSVQSSFPYVRDIWSRNAQEERLLGVSLTGQLSNKALRQRPEWFSALKDVAVQTNAEYASRLGIPQSAAVTLCKPSGTVSQLVACSSGVHPWWSRWFIRRVRITAHDPLCHLLRTVGTPMVPEVGQSWGSASTWVVEFPVEAPEGSVFRHDMSAVEQLEYILMVQECYAEHGVSSTCYVGKDEWTALGKAVLDNFDRIAGVSFLPKDDAIYQLAPYEDIDEETYHRLKEAFPPIPYEMLPVFESGDNTEGSQTLACQGGACEL